MNLDILLQTTLDRCVKGLPPAVAPIKLGEVGQRGWNLLKGDLPLPVAVIKRAALDHNSGWMRRFLELTDARIAPHGKTTMAPQLFAKQLADGAWGITVASVGQMMVARAFGVERIVLANQLVGRQEIATVAEELRRDPAFDFYCLVDSLEGVRRLVAVTASANIGRPQPSSTTSWRSRGCARRRSSSGPVRSSSPPAAPPSSTWRRRGSTTPRRKASRSSSAAAAT
jgi:hypothetical protein